MIDKNLLSLLTGEIVEECKPLTLVELCQICDSSVEQVAEIVEEGIVEPEGADSDSWLFHGVSVGRVRFVLRMERDLGINTAGSALVMELLEELAFVRKQLGEK